MITQVARRVLPRHRRWRRLLQSLTIDPDELPRPLTQPGPRDFIICGAPRTGTSLLAGVLFRPPASVVVMEPWDAFRLAPGELFTSIRAELATGVLRRGRLDVDALRDGSEIKWGRDVQQTVPVAIDDRTAVGVKFPSLWRYLDLLPSTKFLVCVRDPRDTVRSMATTGGRLAAGLDYDIPFNRPMNEALAGTTADEAERRLLHYQYVYERVMPHLTRENVLVVRYERWFDDPQVVVSEIEEFLDIRLGTTGVTISPGKANANAAELHGLVERLVPVAKQLGYA